MRFPSALLLLLLTVQGLLASPEAAVAAAYADARRLPAAEARFARYLWVPHAAADRPAFLTVLRLHLNLLSDQGTFGAPVPVAADLVRLDVREYGWQRRLEVWERLAGIDPFFHAKAKLLRDTTVQTVWPGGRENDKFFKAGIYRVRKKAGKTVDVNGVGVPAAEWGALREMLLTEAPVLNAQWFVVQSARQISIRNVNEKVGYYEWLGLKKRADYFRLVGLDVKLAQRLHAEWRAVVVRSGISQQNRLVGRLGGVDKGEWFTLDVFNATGRGTARRNLRPGEFRHDVEERISRLPNGLPVSILSDQNGVLAESAPDKIGPDDSRLRVGRDARVHANISCWRCHGAENRGDDWLRPVDDWARKAFQGRRLQDYDKKTLLELQSLYLRDLSRHLRRDRTEFAYYLAEVSGGLTTRKLSTLYCEEWNRYVEAPVTLADAARELGTTAEAFAARLKAYALLKGGIDLVLLDYLDGRDLTRLEWEDSYGYARAISLGLAPPDLPSKVRALP